MSRDQRIESEGFIYGVACGYTMIKEPGVWDLDAQVPQQFFVGGLIAEYRIKFRNTSYSKYYCMHTV